jgi:hypothetical protein
VWESPNGDGSFLVDYTVGFTGTPRSGASTVRASTSRSEGYQEPRFDSWDGSRWRWAFTLPGQRKMDVFIVGCGTGYATLGAASGSRFERLRPMFEQMARSLTPQCEYAPATRPSPLASAGVRVRELATRPARDKHRAVT